MKRLGFKKISIRGEISTNALDMVDYQPKSQPINIIVGSSPRVHRIGT